MTISTLSSSSLLQRETGTDAALRELLDLTGRPIRVRASLGVGEEWQAVDAVVTQRLREEQDKTRPRPQRVPLYAAPQRGVSMG